MDYTQLQKWIDDKKSVNKISEISGKSFSTVRYWLKKYNLKTDFLNFRDGKKRKQYTRKEVEEAVEKSKSYSGVFRNLNLIVNGGSYKWIKSLVEYYNIDTSHFSKERTPLIFLQAGIATTYKYQKLIYNKEDISTGCRIGSKKLQKYLKFNNVEYICNSCGIDSWRDFPIRLDVDHIDGNCINNKLSNLQFICPNCHRQKTIKMV